jgi:Fe2+ or Zn2+ uptake regulation protein
MSHVARDFAGHIRQQGYRMTPQRQMVLDVLCGQGGHMTANEVVTAVQQQSPYLNRATVYRALDFLCALQLITRTEMGGQVVYELAEEQPHHHLVCRVCGDMQEWDGRAMDALAAHLLNEHGFQVELNHLALSGICAQCRPGGTP